MIQGLLPVLAGTLLILNTTCTTPHKTVFSDTVGFKLETSQSIQTCIYTVQSGDSVTTIAGKLYGKEDYWTTLWNDNPEIQDVTQIEVGQKLKVRSIIPTKVEDLKPELAKRLGVPADTILHPVEVAYQYPIAQSFQAQVIASIPAASSSSYDVVYQAAGAQYGVPWQILYGIHMAETGGRNGHIMNGAGSGAEGPMQFMPGTFAAYEAPGHSNMDNATDAIYAAANYLSKHGSIQNGLVAYGTNIPAVYQAAASRGYNN